MIKLTGFFVKNGYKATCNHYRKLAYPLFLILLVLLPTSPVQAKYSGGTGEPTNPYQIADANDMNDIRANPVDWDKHFMLVNDINMADYTYSSALINGTFSGTFDGNNCSISNLIVDAGADAMYLGLFKTIGATGWVTNLSIANATIKGGLSSGIQGVLCGSNHGIIRDCNVAGSVSGGVNSDVLGGLCGSNNSGIIINCSANCSILGNDYSSWLGGLCGLNEGGIIINCYATGSVSGKYYPENLGGLCGRNEEGTISNCYATGAVSGGRYSSYLGGFCGSNGLYDNHIGGTITNCYSTGLVAGESWIDGFCGASAGSVRNCYFLDSSGPDNGPASPLTDMQMKQQENFAGWDFINESANGTCQIWKLPADSYPVLSYFDGFVPIELNGSGTELDPWLINDANGLGSIFHRIPSDFYRLLSDLDLEGITWSVTPVPILDGCLNGAGFKIKNLNILGGGFSGLIGLISPGGSIINLGLENVSISGGSYSDYLGGLCGKNYGTISNSYTICSITGGGYSDYLGGLCGRNYGTISNCYATSSITAGDWSKNLGGICGRNNGQVNLCYSSGSISRGGGAPAYLGGLCGYNTGPIGNCYADTSLSGGFFSRYVGGLCGYNTGPINNCYTTGSISPGSYSEDIGGFCGENNGGTIMNSYFLVGSGPDNGYGDSLTDVEMKLQNSFVGWDFVLESDNGTEDVWTIHKHVDYPKHVWKLVNFVDWDGVDFKDYSYFANHWMLTDCSDINNCNSTDLDFSDTVDIKDLKIFLDHWLAGVE